jgi:predicted nucleic acid-binding protein
MTRATIWLSGLREDEAVISVITRAEILCGGEAKEIAAAVDLCGQFRCLAPTEKTADRAAELRRKYHWRLPDAFQAALAAEHGLKLVTRNTRVFPPHKHSFVFVPYALE